ncbi:MAG: hypothetical protein VX666_04480 [Candidatus Thermoplasmatota archaeon]|nr:hypothetical protein [Candidatus Thermoplasmatota archaeon]MEE3201038.1 hypothetical protein [Candidatus Thermoplasmatota archaeon]
MENDELLFLLIFNILGIGLAVWFISTRLRAKLAEVEERKARRWKREPSEGSEE